MTTAHCSHLLISLLNKWANQNLHKIFFFKSKRLRKSLWVYFLGFFEGSIMNISGHRCAACKYLRRRCASDCIFSPYFPSNNPQRFACVHRIYGASNVGKMLQQLPIHLRAQAADTLYFEAQCRIQDPVYGCVRFISQLHQEIHSAESELAKARAEIAFVNAQGQGLQQLQARHVEGTASYSGFMAEQGSMGQSQLGPSAQAPWFI